MADDTPRPPAGSVLDLADTPHRRSEALLPWFVNGTLDSREREEVDHHLASCERCRAEVRRLRDLSQAVHALDVDPACDQAFARLSARMDDHASREAAKLVPWWRGPRVARGIMLGQALLLAVAIGWILRPGAESGGPYRTLASDDTPAGARLILGFREGTSERDVREALGAARARIVDGPSEGGLYVAEVASADRDAAIAALRARPFVRQLDVLAGP